MKITLSTLWKIAAFALALVALPICIIAAQTLVYGVGMKNVDGQGHEATYEAYLEDNGRYTIYV